MEDPTSPLTTPKRGAQLGTPDWDAAARSKRVNAGISGSSYGFGASDRGNCGESRNEPCHSCPTQARDEGRYQTRHIRNPSVERPSDD
eukprot:9501248-Pyramimonas_sp.AAC.1